MIANHCPIYKTNALGTPKSLDLGCIEDFSITFNNLTTRHVLFTDVVFSSCYTEIVLQEIDTSSGYLGLKAQQKGRNLPTNPAPVLLHQTLAFWKC